MFKRKFLLLLSLLSIQITLLAQYQCDEWVIGYNGFGDPDYSVMHLNFNKMKMQIEWHYFEELNLNETCSNICNSDGDAILWTNGMQIFGRFGVHISDTIAYNPDHPEYWNYYHSPNYGALGFPFHDGAIILPKPGDENSYIILYHSGEVNDRGNFQVSSFLSAEIEYKASNEFMIRYLDSTISPYHKWYRETLNAVRHANGRDWWVMTFNDESSQYEAYLLDPNGIHLDHAGQVDMPIKGGLGDASFSSLGNYFARMDAINTSEGQNLTLFSFDRCMGDFVRLTTIHNQVAGFFTGPAFSPSERYMYANDNFHIWQWDLWANDIESSQALVDTFDGFIQPGWFPMYFGPMIEGPDGRIYIIPRAASSEYIHVIDRPDLFAPECRLKQHFINLRKPNGRSAPNLPNYRLGPLDGSPCDTLGLNNLPVARWRYEEDQPGWWYTIRFTDLSFYDPHEWHWDFDDGSTSETPSPLHTFEPGLYHVCLTVSNDYAIDSTCQWIEILPTGLEEVDDQISPDISILPNPFTDQLVIESKNGIFRNALIQLYDMHGRMVFNHELLIPSTIFLPDFPPGIYLCTINDADGSVRSVKLMKE